MARTTVQEHTRHLAAGSDVTVHGHEREYEAGAGDGGDRSAVESYRRAREKARARERREEAAQRGKAAARKGAVGIRRRAGQTKRLCRRGGRRWSRGARYAGRRRRLMATCCFLGGGAEIGAGLAWSAGGLVVTTLSIAAAVVGGGLLLGGQKRDSDGKFAREGSNDPSGTDSVRSRPEPEHEQPARSPSAGGAASAEMDQWRRTGENPQRRQRPRSAPRPRSSTVTGHYARVAEGYDAQAADPAEHPRVRAGAARRADYYRNH